MYGKKKCNFICLCRIFMKRLIRRFDIINFVDIVLLNYFDNLLIIMILMLKF